jgi:hypothetical protein
VVTIFDVCSSGDMEVQRDINDKMIQARRSYLTSLGNRYIATINLKLAIPDSSAESSAGKTSRERGKTSRSLTSVHNEESEAPKT